MDDKPRADDCAFEHILQGMLKKFDIDPNKQTFTY